jgi:uncharacterized protein
LSFPIYQALAAGTERVIAWADVIDRINVFPVPDGDTGRNLVFSLSPLRRMDVSLQTITRNLLLAARGNSGNIASRFFCGFLEGPTLASIPEACRRGRDMAYQAVSNPQPGTMLSLFDALCDALDTHQPDERGDWVDPVLEALENSVRATTDQLPELRNAGVVDAGALGMFVFFEACFMVLTAGETVFSSVAETFKDFLSLNDYWEERADDGYCLDVVLRLDREASAAAGQVYSLGESVVTISDGDLLKVHLHARDEAGVRERLTDVGRIVRWSSDDLAEQTERFSRTRVNQALHIMTDAAGSLTREDAAALGITLLDSYINLEDVSLPETYVERDGFFQAMREGASVSTSQASNLERYQHYHKVLDLYPRVLYLCVGSAFTGNVQVAREWKKAHDPEDRLAVIDTGAASGRLGLAVLSVARKSMRADHAEEVIAFAEKAIRKCREYVFLDKLQYLARGGRLSKTSAFFGDMLKMKPVISPQPQGVEKVGVARNAKDQINMMKRLLAADLTREDEALIMLEYTDNKQWLADTVQPLLEREYPKAEIIFQPMSLTSSAHMGPGTWAVAYLPGQLLRV